MKSRFIKTIRWRLPRHKRSTRLAGAEEDRGRWIKCWNCGFLIDTFKLSLSDQTGIRVSDFPNPNLDLNPSGGILDDTPFMVGYLPKNNAPDGTPNMANYTPRMAEAVAGCPFCGTCNLP